MEIKNRYGDAYTVMAIGPDESMAVEREKKAYLRLPPRANKGKSFSRDEQFIVRDSTSMPFYSVDGVYDAVDGVWTRREDLSE